MFRIFDICFPWQYVTSTCFEREELELKIASVSTIPLFLQMTHNRDTGLYYYYSVNIQIESILNANGNRKLLVSPSNIPFQIELLWFLSEASTYPRRMKDYQASGCPWESRNIIRSFVSWLIPALSSETVGCSVRGQERPRGSWNFRVLIWPLHNVIDGPRLSLSFFFLLLLS